MRTGVMNADDKVTDRELLVESHWFEAADRLRKRMDHFLRRQKNRSPTDHTADRNNFCFM